MKMLIVIALFLAFLWIDWHVVKFLWYFYHPEDKP